MRQKGAKGALVCILTISLLSGCGIVQELGGPGAGGGDNAVGESVEASDGLEPDESAEEPASQKADENAEEPASQKTGENTEEPASQKADENAEEPASQKADENAEEPASQKTAGSTETAKTIYEGLYFDESFYQYVDMPAEESPLVYCEIELSNVTDTSFDFVIYEKVMATGERTVLVPAGTAVIEEPGSKAVYEGDGQKLTFSFPDDGDIFPQHLEISGLEKLEHKVYMNNTIPGHESG